MTHASSKRGQVVAHRGCFANLLALVGASMDPSLRGDDDLLHPFALLRETRPSRTTCPPPDASHRRRQRLLYLQRTRVVRAPHHRKTVAVAIPVAQCERPEDRRGGKGCGSTCRTRGSPYNYKKNNI